MIDFRYHLVSIVAVFLALALGLLLGSTVLRPYALKGLQELSKREKSQIDSLLQTRNLLQGQIASDNQFAQANAPQLLKQLLDGQKVVLVEAPGASGSVISGVTQALHLSGAAVTGQLQLQAPFFDTSAAGSQKLSQLAEQLAQEVPPTGLTLRGSAQDQASELLANSIMTKDGPGQPVAGERDSSSVAVVNGLAGGGFVSTVSGQPADRATLAVVIIPASPPSTNDSNAASQALVTLAEQLNLHSEGAVVAGSIAGSGTGSAIDVMRQDGRAGHLSSVDNADYAIGQIAVVYALVERMHGKSGNYGVLSTANSAAPSPPPTPAPTASATPTLNARAGRAASAAR
jgi:Copper transport outer membrane protein, MctB